MTLPWSDLSWIHGASGVMFFEHEDAPAYIGGPNQHLRSPGSTNLWKECTRLAVEGAELTPALLSDRTAAPQVRVQVADLGPAAAQGKEALDDGVHVVALLEQRLGGGVCVLVANTNNRPVSVTITLSAGTASDGAAPVLFSARNVTVADDSFTDWVDAMGTRAYRLTPAEPLRTAYPWTEGPTATANPHNILLNPSFEAATGGVGGGLPDGLYGTVQGDDAAAAFTDPRDSVHGMHSLRIHTPSDGNGQVFSHFMCPADVMSAFRSNRLLSAFLTPSLSGPDTVYNLSVWARGKTFGGSAASGAGGRKGGPTLLLGFQELHMEKIALTETWARYSMTLKSPPQGAKKWSCYTGTPKVAWELVTAGVAWVDLLELVPANHTAANTRRESTGPALPAVRGEVSTSQLEEVGPTRVRSGGNAPVQDTLGLPLSPIGFFSHELGDPNRSVPVSTQRGGMTSGYIYLPHGDANISNVNAWLDRCDAVGTSVLLDVRFDATIFGGRGGPKPSAATVKAALDATKAKVAALMHHDSVFGWYIADEPDGAHWDPNITAQVYQAVKETDSKGRPVALCVDTTPSMEGNWKPFVPWTDIIMPDIYPINGRPPPPPPPPPGQCANCTAEQPILYGGASAGYYCKAADAPGGHECCLLPGVDEQCQGVSRCGSNPSNFTPCQAATKQHGAATIGPALDRVRAFTDKPIIFIAQAFGGLEGYPRAPTAAEERLMTYIAWIHGSQGVMYFAMDWSAGGGGGRDMPAWDRSECERLGLEGAELTPALASGVNSSDAGAPAVVVSDKRVEAAAFVETGRLDVGGGIIVLVANTANEPLAFNLSLTPGSVEDGAAVVLFANRNLTVADCVISDSVDAMGTRAYRLTKAVGTDESVAADRRRIPQPPRPKPSTENVLLNPSFESSANAEFPDGYSLSIGRDPEAAVFVDSRDSVHGLHSLRLHTPADGAGLQVIACKCSSSLPGFATA